MPPVSGDAVAAGAQSGLHAAIIMDGNGRWAQARGQPRTAGHAAGAHAVRRTVEAAPRLGIRILTLYAFSSDNWQRPAEEVAALMRLFHRYLMAEAGRCADNGVAIEVIGRRDRLSAGLLRVIESAEAVTRTKLRARTEHPLLLRIAVDYSARDAIVRAACRLGALACRDQPSREDFSRLLADPPPGDVLPSLAPVPPAPPAPPAPDVDLLVRTGGEQRLSDFLLWECAYAELVFTERMWPDFGARDLEEAVAEFHRRERRFGRVPAAAELPAATYSPRTMSSATARLNLTGSGSSEPSASTP